MPCGLRSDCGRPGAPFPVSTSRVSWLRVGSDVTRFQPGDEVFGIGKGSFAEFAAAREDKLAHKPSSLTFEQAAAMPVSGQTALRGLATSGACRPGRRC